MRKIFLGITGASGAVYGDRIARFLSDDNNTELHMAVTPDGLQNINIELGKDYSGAEEYASGLNCTLYDYRNFAAAVSSGSFMVDSYIVAPASMGSVGRIASGISSNLIERAADVALKEGRKLVILFREAPLNAVHLENLLKLNRAGAHTVPASPGFYHKPQTLDDLINFMTGKIFDIIDIKHELYERWQG